MVISYNTAGLSITTHVTCETQFYTLINREFLVGDQELLAHVHKVLGGQGGTLGAEVALLK